MTPIYKYYDDPVAIKDDAFNLEYNCKHCKKPKKSRIGTTSNLIAHLKTSGHSEMLEKYLAEQKIYEELIKTKQSESNGKCKRQKRLFPESPAQKTLSNVGVSLVKTVKYPRNSASQKLHFDSLVNMLVKCMLPVSIVENPAFREWLSVIDPPFNVPCRNTIKNTALPVLKKSLKIRIKDTLKK